MRLFGIALLETAVLLAVTPVVVESRVNATGAYNVFMISDCASCTADKDSIFCTAAASPSNGIIDYLGNGSITIAQKVGRYSLSLPRWLLDTGFLRDAPPCCATLPRFRVQISQTNALDGNKFCWQGEEESVAWRNRNSQ